MIPDAQPWAVYRTKKVRHNTYLINKYLINPVFDYILSFMQSLSTYLRAVTLDIGIVKSSPQA